MAQEQEYKYPSVSVPQTPLVRKGRTAAEQGRTAPSEGGLPLGACLTWLRFLLSRVPDRGVLQKFLPPHRQDGPV